ncbi:hypothetical protein RFI_35151 [Reticulomyxa filosa]|uniref:Uncharacterized protein n=1 Tax=Reticulomyxa filosa TaxID=46433 RepID=X6LKY4_RETFI|nr:hypothetical protein RFI_35151 [Reticulomyxa filosa]|eukprot:ETO02284.1 hypothetical protein RFI_35151 [Reticulomyxa filosa]
MSGLLKDNKIDEMFDFYEHQIPKLSLKNNLNVNYNNIITLKSVGYLKKMEALNRNEIDKLPHYHQQYLNVFYNELYPLVKDKPIPIDDKEVDNLLRSYVLLHKSNWMNAVKDVERILYQKPNLIHSLDYWGTDIFNKRQILLDFSLMSTATTNFMLRYLMTLKRDELRHKFKNSAIKILCGKGKYSRIAKKGVHYESPKKNDIEDELRKWKIIIRLEQDKFNEAVWCLNQNDVLLFFKTVPPGENCLKRSSKEYSCFQKWQMYNTYNEKSVFFKFFFLEYVQAFKCDVFLGDVLVKKLLFPIIKIYNFLCFKSLLCGYLFWNLDKIEKKKKRGYLVVIYKKNSTPDIFNIFNINCNFALFFCFLAHFSFTRKENNQSK